jgi:hypothetical protein
MKNLTTLPGVPDSRTVTLGTFDDELFKLPSPQSEVSVHGTAACRSFIANNIL